MQSYLCPLSIYTRGLQCFKLNGNQTENDWYGEKKTFYFLQNVWKCTVFFAFAFKVCKKCYYDPKKIFLEKYQYWYQMPLKNPKPKNYANFEYFRCTFFRGFLLLTFVGGISESRHQRIWNQHKILRFFDTHNDSFQEKKFWVIIALFAYFKCKCEKNCKFSNILQKVKSYFFANIYHSPFDS